MTTTNETAARTWDELADQVQDYLDQVPMDRRILRPPLSDQVTALGLRMSRFRLAAANCRIEGERLRCDDCCDSLVPGVLIRGPLTGPEGVTRCGSCERYWTDLQAAHALAAIVGGTVMYRGQLGGGMLHRTDTTVTMAWPGHYTDDQPYVAAGTHPWVEVDDEAQRWLVTP